MGAEVVWLRAWGLEKLWGEKNLKTLTMGLIAVSETSSPGGTYLSPCSSVVRAKPQNSNISGGRKHGTEMKHRPPRPHQHFHPALIGRSCHSVSC
jgi:hypothetical protein